MLNKSFFGAIIVSFTLLFFVSSCAVTISGNKDEAPKITKEIDDLIFCGSDALTRATFAVEASGSNLKYNWFISDGKTDYSLEEAINAMVKESKDVIIESSDQNLSIYYAAGIDGEFNLSVYVVVTDGNVSVKSNMAKFNSVNCEEALAVKMADMQATVGSSVTLETTVTGSDNVSYEWFVLGKTGWDKIENTESNLYIKTVVAEYNGASVKVIVTDKNTGATAEAIAKLTVTVDQKFSVVLDDVSSFEGDSAAIKIKTFNVKGKLSFQWFYKNVGGEFIKIDGATESIYMTPILTQAQHNGIVFNGCAFDDVLNQELCDQATLSVGPIQEFKLDLLLDVTATAGQAVLFQPQVLSGGVKPYTIQWYEIKATGPEIIPGANQVGFGMENVKITDNLRKFRVQVTDKNAQVKELDATLYVNEEVAPPEPAITLPDINREPGNSATFIPDYKNLEKPFLAINWYEIIDGSDVLLEDETGTQMSFNDVKLSDNGRKFRICITDSLSRKVCDDASLFVTAPEFTVGISNLGGTPGSTIMVSSTPQNGTAPYSYKWYKAGSLLEGETGSILTLVDVTLDDNGVIITTCVTDNGGAGQEKCAEGMLSIKAK